MANRKLIPGHPISRRRVLSGMLKTGLALGAGAAGGISLASPRAFGGTPAKKDEVTLRLNFYVAGTQAPFYYGLVKGYFDQENIALTIGEGAGSAKTAQLVGNKSDTFGMADPASMSLAKVKGLPVKAIASLQSRGALGVIFLDDSPIKTIKDVEGRSLAVTPGDSLTQLWPAVVAANRLDAGKITLLSMTPAAKPVAVMERKADALLGSVGDQPLIMESKGFKVRSILFADVGVRLIGMCIVAHEDTLKEKPDLVRRFLKATVRTFPEALQNMDEVAAAVRKFKDGVNPDTIKKQLAISAKFWYSAVGTTPRFGWGEPKDWQDTIDMLNTYQKLEGGRPPEFFYTNEFLPR